MAMGHSDRLVRRTRRRLFAVTLGLLALLVVGVGSATAVMGLAALDADVDHALRAAVAAQAAAVARRRSGTDGGEATNGEDGTDTPETDERHPAAADTFLLVLDATGRVVQNPSGRTIAGLPGRGGPRRGEAAGEDLRTIEAGGPQPSPADRAGDPRTAPSPGSSRAASSSTSTTASRGASSLAVVTVGAMGLDRRRR